MGEEINLFICCGRTMYYQGDEVMKLSPEFSYRQASVQPTLEEFVRTFIEIMSNG